MIYREYTKEERLDPLDRSVFYGWSASKEMVKAFLEQRNPKKYKVRKFYKDEITKFFHEDLTQDTMLNFASLKSARDNKNYILVMTQNELQNAEKKVVRFFAKICDMEDAGEDLLDVLRLFVNLIPEYAKALDFIGFRPSALDDLFPSADPRDDPSSTQYLEEGIDEEYQYPADFAGIQPVSPWITGDVSKQIIYSLESFVKVLREDM